jgi:hypothetical protein
MLARPRLHLICALCLGLALAAAIHAQSASAAIADLTRAQSNSPPSASADTTVTVSCPPDKRLLGGGADATSGSNIAINDLIPDATLSSLTAEALEDPTGTTDSW